MKADLTDDGNPAAGQPSVCTLYPAAYRGLDRYDARKKVIEHFESAGLLERIDDHRLMVPRGDRSGAVIEPYLTDQWFVRTEALAQPAIEAVENGRIRFVPDNWRKTYFEWMRNIEDWCISRQIWWGHRIPAWYDEHGNVYVGRDEQDVRTRHGLSPEAQLSRDLDVLDTWFSSALWPFSTLGWPDNTEALKNYYPTSVLVTGFDIIFFWVARMIMMGLKFAGDIPFREIYMHGLVRDAQGQKMSKSKGNVLDPIDLIDGIDLESLVQKRTRGLMQPQMAHRIEKATCKEFPDGIPAFGTDALRFTFAALATHGRDIRFDLGRVEGYRNFCNKLWNAARYVLMSVEGEDAGLGGGQMEYSVPDRWIQARLNARVAEVRQHIDSYRFDLAAQALYEFTWNEYCDWYLELSKPVLQSTAASAAEKRATRRTLLEVLETLLRLMHPVMPFITEDIWQRVAPLTGVTGETISLRPYPVADAAGQDEQAIGEIEWLQSFILGLRRIRGEMDIAPSRPLPVVLQDATDTDRTRVSAYESYLSRLARVESIRYLAAGEEPPESATALIGTLKILVPMAGIIDAEAELERLDKQLHKLNQDLERVEKKLNNAQFTLNAPTAVVAKEQARAESIKIAINELDTQRARIARLT